MALGRAWKRVLVSDPDLGRARMAARATATAALATAAVTVLARVVAQPVVVGLPAIMLAMLTSVLVADATVRAQRRTHLMAPVVACAGLSLGALLANHVVAGRAAFLLVVFVAVRERRRGPRGVALGFLGYMSYFTTLFFRLQGRQLPWTIGAMLVAQTVSFAVRFVVLPDREPALVRRTLANLLRAAELTLEVLVHAARAPARVRLRARVRHALAELNAVSLVLDDHLALSSDEPAEARARATEVQGAALELERAVAYVVALARARADRGEPIDLDLLREGMRRMGDASAPTHKPADLELGAAVDALVHAALAVRAVDLASASRDPLRPAPRVAGPAVGGRIGNATRLAVQATLACTLAMAAGWAISPMRWYWAVIAAFVTFVRAETVAETVQRAWQRIMGTALGVAVGMHLGALAAGHRALELALLFACLLAAYYLLRVAYAAMVVALTLALAELYGLLGRLSPGVLEVRIVLTAVGCGIGALVAASVLPASTGRRLRLTVAALLRELSELLVIEPNATAASVLDRVRRLDQRLAMVRETAQPLAGPVVSLVRSEPMRLLHAARAAAYYARHFALERARGLAEPDGNGSLARDLATHALAFAETLQGRRALPSIERPTTSPAHMNGPEYWLGRLHEALADLRETLSVNASV